MADQRHHGATRLGDVPPVRREQGAQRSHSDRRYDTDPKIHGGSKEAPSGLAAVIAMVMDLRIVRAFQRYGKANGAMLAGGIAYTTIFSLVAALTIVWSVFMATLGRDEAMRQDVVEAVNNALPGLLKESPDDTAGMIDPNSLMLDSALNPATIIAALVLLWTATSLMTNIRRAVQAQFGIVAPPENFVLQKLRDLLGFVLLAIGVVAVTTVSTVASTLGETVLGAVGLGDNPVVGWLLRIVGLAAAVFVSALTFIQLFRLTSAVRVPAKDLWLGAIVGGVVINVVLTLGTQLVSSVSDDPLLAASASLATLLLWINLLSRVLLVIAAFTANPPQPEMPDDKSEVHFSETPNYITVSAPHTIEWEHQDVTGQLDPDPRLNPDKDDETGLPLALSEDEEAAQGEDAKDDKNREDAKSAKNDEDAVAHVKDGEARYLGTPEGRRVRAERDGRSHGGSRPARDA